MSLEKCREAFALQSNRVEAVNSCSDTLCYCEQHSVSDFSPHPVGDEEILHFLVPSPEGRSENGTINPTNALQLFRNGLSVLRELAADEEFIITISELQPHWRSKDKKLDGVISFHAKDVRYKDQERVCGIYDSGMEKKPHHADLMCPKISGANGEKLSRTKREFLEKQAVKAMVELIGNNFTECSVFRNGIFKTIVFAD